MRKIVFLTTFCVSFSLFAQNDFEAQDYCRASNNHGKVLSTVVQPIYNELSNDQKVSNNDIDILVSTIDRLHINPNQLLCVQIKKKTNNQNQKEDYVSLPRMLLEKNEFEHLNKLLVTYKLYFNKKRMEDFEKTVMAKHKEAHTGSSNNLKNQTLALLVQVQNLKKKQSPQNDWQQLFIQIKDSDIAEVYRAMMIRSDFDEKWQRALKKNILWRSEIKKLQHCIEVCKKIKAVRKKWNNGGGVAEYNYTPPILKAFSKARYISLSINQVLSRGEYLYEPQEIALYWQSYNNSIDAEEIRKQLATIIEIDSCSREKNVSSNYWKEKHMPFFDLCEKSENKWPDTFRNVRSVLEKLYYEKYTGSYMLEDQHINGFAGIIDSAFDTHVFYQRSNEAKHILKKVLNC